MQPAHSPAQPHNLGGPEAHSFSKVLNASTMDTRILKEFYSDSSVIRRWNWDCDLSGNNVIPALLRPEGDANQSYTKCVISIITHT